MLGPKGLCKPDSPRLAHHAAGRPAGGSASLLWRSPAARLDVHSQMWRDGLPFRSIVQALQAWVNSEAHISALAIDYCCGYRVGILTNRLTRDVMRALHRDFELVRPRFGKHQAVVYVLGNKERDAHIFTDDTSYIIRGSKCHLPRNRGSRR